MLKRHQLTTDLSQQVDQKHNELKEFQQTNFNDLGRVLRSLYVFESRLRKEQQQIRRQLGERDSVIRQQQLEIAKLRQSLAYCCHRNEEAEISTSSKPDLITSISPQLNCEPVKNDDSPSSGKPKVVPPPPPPPSPPPPPPPPLKSEGTSKNVLPPPVDTRTKKNANNNINFNKNVYSKTVTDLSLNDISSFPNPTPNNNLFVVSNSVFSKNEFTYNEVSKEVNLFRVFVVFVRVWRIRSRDVCRPSLLSVGFYIIVVIFPAKILTERNPPIDDVKIAPSSSLRIKFNT